jgi:hypothetical protein
MGFNRRRHANTLPLASIAIWITVAAFVCAAGLFYVYCKNQLHITGTKIKLLERELEALIKQDEVVRAKIASLSSHAALQRRLDDGFIKLVPITDDRLVRVEASPIRAPSELRSVVNERSAR